LRFFITSTGQNHPENAFKEIDLPWVKTVLGLILKKLYEDADVFVVLVLPPSPVFFCGAASLARPT
jgi:hypothetical protein